MSGAKIFAPKVLHSRNSDPILVAHSILKVKGDLLMSKTKYVVYLCMSCGKETKMAILGSMEGEESKVWYRCTRCHHSTMIDMSKRTVEDNVIKFNKEECTSYSPERSYTVGELIYHSDWDDMGKVTAKEKTSSGGRAILVSFEKLGSRRLIENLPAE